MGRNLIKEKERTTIVANKLLFDRINHHVLETRESQTEFIVRALINQLENDGDLTIREEMEENNG